MTTTARRFSTIIRPDQNLSGHTFYVHAVDRDELPANVQEALEEYTTFYAVRNWDADGVVFFYLGKGYRHPDARYANDSSAHDPKELVVGYLNGQVARGRAETIIGAVTMGQRLGWLCTGA